MTGAIIMSAQDEFAHGVRGHKQKRLPLDKSFRQTNFLHKTDNITCSGMENEGGQDSGWRREQ